MAADLIMPTLPGDQQSRHFFPQQRPHHQRNQSYQISVGPQISPINTHESTSPDSISSNPTSPRAYQARQARPMYMPAALRPNLFPSKAKNKSVVDDAASASSTESDTTLRRTNSSIMNLPGMSVFGNRLSRVSTGDSTRSSIDGDFDLEMFPEVMAFPTRKHWKPDSESSVCDDPTCKRTFSYFTRRHHCRKCGNIFCDFHSTFAVPLDQDAKFNPRAAPSRTCRHCFEEFKSWYSRNSSRASSAASSDAPNPVPSTPIAAGGQGDRSELLEDPRLLPVYLGIGTGAPSRRTRDARPSS
ncbi:hypothetical protein NM208_g16022 [Fusarium decemcellulare]|uniref:Uncharacterized protein n=1 Tax=Fusarium decemcellulare TaxID=57161 RepID=A0ACC1RBD1_9HYPO|nr:hypothetical protein NM208_g16022 [Fusarium decemcellulare]